MMMNWKGFSKRIRAFIPKKYIQKLKRLMKKKRIRIFHPRKLWLTLATIALTVGVAVGEARVSDPQIEISTPTKLNRDIQASSFSVSDSSKQGARRLPYNLSKLTSKDANPLEQDDPLREGVKSVCFWEDVLAEGELAVYSAEIPEVKVSDDILPGESFRVQMYLKNTGNVTWFSLDSNCPDKPAVNLGTIKTTDRASVFFQEGEQTGWIGNNRVQMVEDAVKPGETATFAFTSVAPVTDTIYREYFSLVAEGTTWFEGFEVPVDIRVGEITEEDETKLAFINAVSIDTRSLTGDKSIQVDLSDQRMVLAYGDIAAYELPVSTGASSTPTPTGTYKIMNKQELRVGGASPHYRMPYFQQFTSQGHGLHALPYLGSEGGGWFWEEALDHIGTPVSHGCIRMLPEDAVRVYEFSDVSMALVIER